MRPTFEQSSSPEPERDPFAGGPSGRPRVIAVVAAVLIAICGLFVLPGLIHSSGGEGSSRVPTAIPSVDAHGLTPIDVELVNAELELANTDLGKLDKAMSPADVTTLGKAVTAQADLICSQAAKAALGFDTPGLKETFAAAFQQGATMGSLTIKASPEQAERLWQATVAYCHET